MAQAANRMFGVYLVLRVGSPVFVGGACERVSAKWSTAEILCYLSPFYLIPEVFGKAFVDRALSYLKAAGKAISLFWFLAECDPF